MKKSTIAVFLLSCLVIGSLLYCYSLRQSLQKEQGRSQQINRQLQHELSRNRLVNCGMEVLRVGAPNAARREIDTCDIINVVRAVDEIYEGFRDCGTRADSSKVMAEWLHRCFNPENSVNHRVGYVERKQSWEDAMSGIKSELFSCKDWFDTVTVLSAWLYQNIRVGDPELGMDKTFGGNNLNKWYATIYKKDLKWFYDVNSSDSVASNCGSHCYFATRLYEHFNIKSYHLSLRENLSSSEDGHMINVLYNPHDQQWYPVDCFFGIRWKSRGKWVSMTTYARLSKSDLNGIDVEYFGTSKFHLYKAPLMLFNSWSLNTWEIIQIEPSNYRNYFRIAAPYTLGKRFPAHKEQFDAIAASYNQPPHVDWMDLARRMPMYGMKLFSPPPLKEQDYADSLLKEWKQQ